MASTGLSRRRVANGPQLASPSTPTSPSTSSTITPTAATLSHAGSAFEGGSKVAYDPRDLESVDDEVKEGGKVPKLTLMEELLLLGIKDKQVSVNVLSLDPPSFRRTVVRKWHLNHHSTFSRLIFFC
jgi:Golgi phosphoprotein 3